jgi:hypothetical protein
VEKLRNLAEKREKAAEKLRSLPEKRGNVSGWLGNAGEIQLYADELRKTVRAMPKSWAGSAHREILLSSPLPRFRQ